jgi:hypothetical protein
MATKKTTGAEKTKAPKSPDLTSFLHEIKEKAYEIFLKRQMANAPGDELSDWLNAEAEIKKKYKIK